jgi:hypothetical protein
MVDTNTRLRQCLVNQEVDSCRTTSIEQGLKPDRFPGFFGAAKDAP